MKLLELKAKVQEYQYFEDTGVIDMALAAIISTRLKLGDPIWLVIIGASSGGKSQILRPLSLTDPKYMHRIDDLTENTFLSGMKSKDSETSLLHRIGSNGILVMSDLTVLFSRQAESRSAILAQFRMIYDGEMTKMSGAKDIPPWRGSLGVLAGSTPSIYGHFEEVADMGERFIYYRMKDYDARKATEMALGRKMFGKKLDDELATAYDQYIKEVTKNFLDHGSEIVLRDWVINRIIEVAMFAERVRTAAHIDHYSRDKRIDKIPVPAFPMRVALQLMSLARGFAIMRMAETDGGEITESDMAIIDWCGWSLANEEKRACLRILSQGAFGNEMKTQTIADKVGLDTSVIGNILQNMSAIGILSRGGDTNGLSWRITKEDDWKIVRRIEGINEILSQQGERILSQEENGEENERVLQSAWDTFGK